ncbi:thermonuclease family protein [Mesorhizobium sp. 10J20-29]
MLSLISSTIIACASLSAVDGDTIKCNGQNMRIMGNGAPFKSGVDTPEIRNAQCAKERLLGVQAKLRLSELIVEPGTEIEDSGKRDRYGRPLVWVRLANGRTAGATLVAEGYAVVWRPGAKVSWCD